MIKKCLFINDKTPFSENLFNHIPDIEMVWCQNSSLSDSLETVLDTHSDTNILITRHFDLSAFRLQKMPRLELIITMTTGIGFIDKSYCEQNNITIMNTPRFSGPAVAEHAVAMMLAAAKNIVDLDGRTGREDFYTFGQPAIELFQKKAGIIGLGDIGQRLARILNGFGMEISYYRRTKINFEIARQVELDTLLFQSDVIFLTLPMNENSRHLIDSRAFSKMKQGAMLVSISPEALIVFDALKEALESGILSYACLDLIHPDNRYKELPNILTTPCRGWNTKESDQRRAQIFTATLKRYMQECKQNLSF